MEFLKVISVMVRRPVVHPPLYPNVIFPNFLVTAIPKNLDTL